MMVERQPLPHWAWAVIVTHVLLLVYLAWSHSPLHNENEYLPSGICHWKTGRLEPSCRNPPLPRLVGALPVLMIPHKIRLETSLGDIYQHPGMAMSREFLEDNKESIRWLFFVGRLACIPFSIVGAIVCYYWAGELFGRFAAGAALLLWCFSPNMLANNFLIMPDGIATSLGLWAAYRYRHWLREPNWGNSLLAGVSLGWTLLAKATWTVLLFLYPLLWLVSRSYKKHPERTAPFLTELVQLLLVYAVALFLINATYGFEGSFKLLGKYEFRSRALSGRAPAQRLTTMVSPPTHEAGNRFLRWKLALVPVPLPELYVKGIDIQLRAVERLGQNFLFGHWKEKGWWYYYFAAALVKMPVGTWLLLVAACVAALTSRHYRASWREELWLLAPALTLLVFLMGQSTISRHFRYVLPLGPFLFISISRVACREPSSQPTWKDSLSMGTLVVSLTATLVSSFAVYPHSLSYFNEAIGGPNYGHYYLLGSNIDRGQDEYYLKHWQQTHPDVSELNKVSHMFSGGEASRAVLNAGWYAVSVNNLFDPRSVYYILKDVQPVTQVGYTTRIYYVPADLLTDSAKTEVTPQE